MPSLAPVADARQEVLTVVAADAARETGFVRRRRVLTGAAFVQALVLGWLADPAVSLAGLAQRLAALGAGMSPQGWERRFTEAAAQTLERVLAAAVGAVVTAGGAAVPLLARCDGVSVLDSTTIRRPAALAEQWPGCGGRTGAVGEQAAVKLQVRLDLGGGGLEGPTPTPGTAQDQASPFQRAPLPPGALRRADLGFWSLPVFRAVAEAGAFWLARLHLQGHVFAADGARLDRPRWLARQGAAVDAPVRLGAGERLEARLLAERLPEAVAAERRRTRRAAAKRDGKTPSADRLALAGWSLFATNAPADRRSPRAALVLARARWQVELLFKLWKQHGRVDESRSAQPDRILTELYAKLTAMVIQHWILLVGCWAFPNRSLGQAAQTVRAHAVALLLALAHRPRLLGELRTIRRCLGAGCQLNRRKTKPNTDQLLLDPALGALT